MERIETAIYRGDTEDVRDYLTQEYTFDRLDFEEGDELLNHPIEGNDHTLLSLASRWDEHEIVGLLLDHGADPHLESHGLTPLDFAAFDGHIKTIQKFIDRYVDLNHEDSKGRTPLMWACMGRQAAAVKLLLDHGANPDTIDDKGQTSLILCCRKGSPQISIVKHLLEAEADIPSVDDKGNRASDYWPGLLKMLEKVES